jgi:uncharacterized protein YfaS (alpha-2-macroglobulin family)
VPALEEELLKGVVFRLHQGREVFGGLQEGRRVASGLVHPSDARTLAEMVRALDATGHAQPRLPLLLEGLLGLADETGWGSTSANSAAVLALSEVLEPPLRGGGQGTLRLAIGDRIEELVVGPGESIGVREWTDPGAVEVLQSDGSGPLLVKLDRRYTPAESGSQAAPLASGFVVTRELLVGAGGEAPPRHFDLSKPGQIIHLTVGTVVEEHLRIVNPQDRHFVALEIPLAAGMEPMNPALATSPPEASPKGRPTLEPTYVDARDDALLFYYDALPRGTYDVFYRTRASIPGTFSQPPAQARAMYDLTVEGASGGARVVVKGAGGQE